MILPNSDRTLRRFYGLRMMLCRLSKYSGTIGHTRRTGQNAILVGWPRHVVYQGIVGSIRQSPIECNFTSTPGPLFSLFQGVYATASSDLFTGYKPGRSLVQTPIFKHKKKTTYFRLFCLYRMITPLFSHSSNQGIVDDDSYKAS